MYVVSFYSFKGGVGRTVGLLNTAWHLARQGRRVILLDLDLEAPGLGSAWLHDTGSGVGNDTGGEAADRPRPEAGFCELVQEFKESHAFPADWTSRHLYRDLGPDGRIALMAAAGSDLTATKNLENFVQTFSWSSFYVEDLGRDFMEILVEELAWDFDYLLIDARTGLTPVAGVSLLHLPDLAVLVTNLSRQSVEGIGDRLKEIEQVNDECRSPGGSVKRRRNAERQPIECLLVGSPLPTGEWRSRHDRIHEIERQLGRELTVQIDYLPLLALDEEFHILARHMKNGRHSADELLIGATGAFERLAKHIEERNPEDPENLIEQGRRLLEAGLWRDALTHFDEVFERARSRGEDRTLGAPLEARLNKVPAMLRALETKPARQELERLEEELTSKSRLPKSALRLAQIWLEVSWTYVLLNDFQGAVTAAETSNRLIEKAEIDHQTDPLAKPLRALALLRRGSALGLTGAWDEAIGELEECTQLYAGLRTRPLLYCSSLAELAAARVTKAGDSLDKAEGDLKQAWAVIDGGSAFGEVETGHVKAQVHFSNAKLKTERGAGVKARKELAKAWKLFAEEGDFVGQAEIVLSWCSLGLEPPAIDSEKLEAGGRSSWADWTKRTENLRMSRVTWRLELQRLAWTLAFKGPEAVEYDGGQAYGDRLLAGSARSRDPALTSWTHLEHCRYLFATAPTGQTDESSLGPIRDLLRKAQVELYGSDEHSKTQGAAEEAEHDYALLKVLFRLATGERLVEELKQRIEYYEKLGYVLRKAQASFVLEMLLFEEDKTPDTRGILDQDGVPGIQKPAKWSWNLPLLFLERCPIPQLETPYLALRKQLGDNWPRKSF